MRMIIRNRNGVRAEAILLAAGRDRMRVAIDSEPDTTELHLFDGEWYTDEGSAIEFEAIFPVDGMDVSRFCADVHPRAMAAGATIVWD